MYFPVDLHGNGVDEFFQLKESAFVLYTHNHDVIDQINFSDELVHNGIHFLDLDDNNDDEILLAYKRNDSLFVNCIEVRGNSIHTFCDFYITSGEPRITPQGAIAWNPSVSQLFLDDVDGDGRKDLISIIATMTASQPRGVWVNKLPGGESLGEFLIGGMPVSPGSLRSNVGSILNDFNQVGHKEILFVTGSTDNGNTAVGIDDRYPFIGLFELYHELVLSWHEQIGEKWFDPGLWSGDFNGEGKTEHLLIVLTSRTPDSNPSQLCIVDPSAKDFLTLHTHPTPLLSALVLDMVLSFIRIRPVPKIRVLYYIVLSMNPKRSLFLQSPAYPL